MVWNHGSAMWRIDVPENDVAATPAIEGKSNLSRRLHHFRTGKLRQVLAHPLTSTISSEIEGGIGS